MVKSAEIASPRVDIGARSVKLQKGLNEAESKLKNFAKRAKSIGKTLAGAIGLGSILSLGGLTAALATASGEIDNITKRSRSVGVLTSELSGLAHAADQGGVNFDVLARGMRNISRNAFDGLNNKAGAFATIMRQLNVEFVNADGTLRSATDVMLDVADRFQKMKDGGDKTLAAMKAIGEEAGPQLISTLNLGSDALRKYIDEARDLGLVFSAEEGAKVEAMNDAWDRLGKRMTGLARQITIAVSPAMKDLAERLEFGLSGVAKLTLKLLELTDALKSLPAWMKQSAIVQGELNKAIFAGGKSIAEISAAIDQKNSRLAQFAIATFGAGEQQKQLNIRIGDGVAANKAAAEAERKRLELMREGKALTESLFDPLERYAAALEKIRKLQAAGAIDSKTAGRANQRAAATSANAYASMASDIAGNLSTLFGENKAFAIASAVINTAQGVTKALGAYAPPWNFAVAASVAAAGAAQIAQIRKTQKSSSGGGGGGGASVGGSSGPVQQPAAVPQEQLLTVSGVEPGTFYSDDVIRGIIGRINEAGDDGVVLRARVV